MFIKECIRLRTEKEFSEIADQRKQQGKREDLRLVWKTFGEDTCYILEEEVFISLPKALELGFKVSQK